MTNYLAAFIDEIWNVGIRDVVISPGSRSTPLAILFCEHEFNVYVNVDERSAGFFALGIAKEKIRPAVLVCTSGSAAAHYYPAIIEAKHSRVPLIVISADRPPELQNVGAPQTINQVNLFGHFVNHFEQLAVPEDTDERYPEARSLVRRVYIKAIDEAAGVVHLNIPLREPLIPNYAKLDFTVGRSEYGFQYLSNKQNRLSDEEILRAFNGKNGIIVCGPDANSDYHHEILELAQRLKCPILADPLSNLRRTGFESIIDSYDTFLRHESIRLSLLPHYVLHVGQVPVSKSLQKFLCSLKNCLTIQIDEGGAYKYTTGSDALYIKAPVKETLISIKMENEDTKYVDSWKRIQQKTRTRINEAKEVVPLFEGKIIQTIQNLVLEGTRLFIANSMAIRDVDSFWENRAQDIKLLCNRGANGIDGTVSTALGVATSGHPTVLVTGDLAFFHDLNGLLIGKTHGLDLTIVLMNNDGGGIFQYLPQYEGKHYDYLFRTSHGIDFQSLESGYGVKYTALTTDQQFSHAFALSLQERGITLIEVKIDMECSKKLHERYIQRVDL